jgi:glutathione-independent formaldehyde dehydrogenase
VVRATGKIGDEAVHAYDQFDQRVDGWTKVLLHPGKAA